jgi:hypothetical protein
MHPLDESPAKSEENKRGRPGVRWQARSARRAGDEEMSRRERGHLRVLIANERKDRLAPLRSERITFSATASVSAPRRRARAPGRAPRGVGVAYGLQLKSGPLGPPHKFLQISDGASRTRTDDLLGAISAPSGSELGLISGFPSLRVGSPNTFPNSLQPVLPARQRAAFGTRHELGVAAGPSCEGTRS